MQLVILLLLVAALVLLVLSLIGGNSTLAVFSVVVSVLAVAAIVRGRRQRQELAAQRLAETERLAQVEADKDETTRVLAAATAEASRRAAADSATGSDAPAAQGPPQSPLQSQPKSPLQSQPQPAAVATETAIGVDGVDGAADDDDADPPAADTMAPLQRYAQSRVWVIDGRPRYHLAECQRLNGQVPEAVSLSQAVEDGFTPCSSCDPDNKLAG